MAATVTPNAAAQMRPLVLTLAPGANGYRIAFAGGDYFEPIAEGRDPVELHRSMREAVGLTSALLWEVFGERK